MIGHHLTWALILSANAADAYCYYVVLGRADGARALQSMALPGDKYPLFNGRIECSYKHLGDKIKNHLEELNTKSLEAYLLSPFIGRRLELVQLSKSKRLKIHDVRSPSASHVPAMELTIAVESLPAVVATADEAEPQQQAAAALERDRKSVV